jgi:hypothetical protein
VLVRFIASPHIHFVIGVWSAKAAESGPVNYWEIIADRLLKAGWSLGWVSAMDSEGRTIWIVDAHRGDGRRFIVHADEKLSAFVELERQVLTVTFYLQSIHADSGRFAALTVTTFRGVYAGVFLKALKRKGVS